MVCNLKQPTGSSAGPEAVFANLLAFIQRLASESGIDQTRIRGVGIGIPGVVLRQKVVQWALS